MTKLHQLVNNQWPKPHPHKTPLQLNPNQPNDYDSNY